MSRFAVVFVAVLAIAFVNADEVKDVETKKEVKSAAPAAPASPIGAGASTYSCYQCNSANVGEEDCTSTEPDVLQKFIKPCSSVPKGTTLDLQDGANACRKIDQHIGDEVPRVIRECAYTETDELMDGKKRTGNKGVVSYFYSCKNADGQPCNPANQAVLGLATLLPVALLLQRL